MNLEEYARSKESDTVKTEFRNLTNWQVFIMNLDFTIEEFDQLISEMENSEKADRTLFVIAEKIVKKRLRGLCYKTRFLNEFDEEDIYLSILVRLWKSYVTHFFRNSRVPAGEINNDPEGFQAWIIKITRNEYCRFLSNRMKQLEQEIPLLSERRSKYDDEKNGRENKDVERVEIDNYELEEENINTAIALRPMIMMLFEVVIDSKKRIYMILSWLSVHVHILDMHMDRINATNQTVLRYSDKKLTDIWKELYSVLRTYDWINISPERINKINTALKRTLSSGELYGNCTLGGFFGKKDGSAVISDWVYRINNYIKDRINDETFDD